MKLYQIGQGSYHLTEEETGSSMLSRYKVLREQTRTAPDEGIGLADSGAVLQTPKGPRAFTWEKKKKGFRLRVELEPGERLFGLGDATRERVMVRGLRTDMTVANVKSYGPMPLLYSNRGWGLVLNCTYRSIFDCGAENPDRVTIDTAGGEIDFFLFAGDSLKTLHSRITALIGRPMLLPKFAYGLTLVQNEETDVRSMLWDIRTLRDRNIPCDVMGLEPSWMATRYDCSVNKDWNREKFPIPYWVGRENCGSFTFFYAMRQMGMQLSLWLCTEYDIFFAEENNTEAEEKVEIDPDAAIFDEHFASQVRVDAFTKVDQPWFEHLKHFVNQGAAAFKLDGSNQINEHPDRLWGGKYTDDEAHNIYPVLLARQISRGFTDYTDRRLLLYTAGAYLGTQQYAATWAGDTGGGQKTLVSLMNYAMCGHSNTSCDIDVASLAGVHYGFLIPWAQYFCWDNWRHPWFLRPEMEEGIRYYANLRSALVPYLYTMAHVASVTGLPLLRPLPLMYEDTDRFDNVNNAYMLGDDLFVGVFDMNLPLPEGTWVDWFTGKTYTGGTDLQYEIPEGKGGALFARAGSMIMTMKPQHYVMEKQHDYVLRVFPGADCEFTLYEDDCFTEDYRKGGYVETRYALHHTGENTFELTAFPRTGSFTGRPDNGSDLQENSVPAILPPPPVKDLTLAIEGPVDTVTLDGEELPVTYDGRVSAVVLPAARQDREAVLTVKMKKNEAGKE